jgi:hypothetical protein
MATMGRWLGWLGAAVCALVAVPAGAASAATWSVTSPDGAIRADVAQAAPGGALTLAVRRGGVAVLGPSPLGLVTSRGDLTTGLAFRGRDDRVVDERYETATGPRRAHRHHATAMRLRFAGSGDQTLELEVRASADGAAFRYVLPGSGPIEIEREATAFELAAAERVFRQPYTPNYEGLWGGVSERSVTDLAGQTGFPLLAEIGAGTWALLAESGVDGRYVTSMLEGGGPAQPRRFAVTFPPPYRTTDVGPVPASAVPSRPEGALPLATPWRLVVTGDLATVTESGLVTDLAPPREPGDWSWVRPGKVAWSWWSDFESPHDFAEQQRYVDFAAEHGWPFVLVDEGWRDWEARVPELVAYARDRGVAVLLWLHNRDVDTPEERPVLERLAGWGVAGVKIDFFDSDDQTTMQLFDALLAETARVRLMVNFHGATLPKGLRRRWPHLMTYEAVRGAEFYKWHERYQVSPAPTAQHNTILPFTRAVLGPLDYTPTTFTAPGRRTSDGHELALAVVYESGWQHLADSRQSYAARPVALAVLDALPTVWDDTRLLDGEPGRHAVLARRAGADWWIGAITAGEARTLRVPLGALPAGRRFTAEITTDAAGGLRTQRRTVTRRDTLSVAAAEDGGFVVRLRARGGGAGARTPRARRRAGVRAWTTPRRDRRRPWVFTTRGRVLAPAGMRPTACRGRVSVTFKRGRRTVSSRRTRLRRDCTFRSRVRFGLRRRLAAPRRLRVLVRFEGNGALLPRRARTHHVRVR